MATPKTKEDVKKEIDRVSTTITKEELEKADRIIAANKKQAELNERLRKQYAGASLSTRDLYSSDKMKNAQFDYNLKMHTPSSMTANFGSKTNISGVIGSKFGHIAGNTINDLPSSITKATLNFTKTGIGLTESTIGQDKGASIVLDTISTAGNIASATIGDVSAVGRRAYNAMCLVASTSESLGVNNLSNLNKNTLSNHFGTADLTKLSDSQIKQGCISLLKSKDIKFSEDILVGNSSLVIKRLNRLIENTSDKDAIAALNVLKGKSFRVGIRSDIRKPNFRLIRVGSMLSNRAKNKYLSNDSMEGLAFIQRAKDRAESLLRTTLKFFHNIRKAGQKGIKLAYRGALRLKRSRLVKAIENKVKARKKAKLIDKYYKKRLNGKNYKRIKKNIDKLAGKTTKEAAKQIGLKAQMDALKSTIIRNTVGKAIKRLAATKVGGFIVKKVGESAVANVIGDFFAKWVPVVGQIWFVVEIVLVVLLTIFIVIAVVQLKTTIDEIGNAANYQDEAMEKYCQELKICSDQYKNYYNGVMNRDNGRYLNTSQAHVPLLISHLTTGDVNVYFNDYMALDSYKYSSVDYDVLQSQYGNQPEILIMGHVMSEMAMDDESPEFIEKYREQLCALYYLSHIMYINYYQTPIGKEYPTSTDTIQINKLEYVQDEDSDEGYYKEIDEDEDGNPLEDPISLGIYQKIPSTLKVKWNADVNMDVYYYDNLFSFMNSKDQAALFQRPQLYVRYTQGMNSLHSSSFDEHSMNTEDVNKCMIKVNSKIEAKLAEKGLVTDSIAITSGIVTNVISESGCRSNNYEDQFNGEHGLSDEQVTMKYNEIIKSSSSFNEVWNKYLSGWNTGGVKLRGGYGLCQWTDEERKKGLFRKAFEENKSIDDYDMQVEYMIYEMEERGYFKSGGIFANNSNAGTIGYFLCEWFERPLAVVKGDLSVCSSRGQRAITLYNTYSGCIGDIEYDDDNMNDFADFLTGSPSTNASVAEYSRDISIIDDYEDGFLDVTGFQNSNTFISDYLRVQNFRPAPDEYQVANLYAGNYGPFKDISEIKSGDIIVWKDYAAIYIGNDKVLCCQSLRNISADTEITGKYPLQSIIKVMGNDYKVLSPIPETNTSEE